MNKKKEGIPKIKICGLTRDCDINYVNEARPDYIGFVFAHTRREISGRNACCLRERTAEGIQAVGVFVDESQGRIEELLKIKAIDMVQLHGHEDAEYIKRLKERTGCCIIKAMHPGKKTEADVYEQYQQAGVDYFLFDSSNQTQVGGTGRTFDWQLIPKVSRPWFLSGGLNIENVESAMELQPYALDISSGVETEGYKDREKILEMIRRIRNV